MERKEESKKKFHEYLLRDYEGHLFVEKIIKFNFFVIKNEKVDPSFTQIAIKPLLDNRMFVDSYYLPELVGAGRTIALGEKKFLIQNILSDKEIKTVQIEKKNFTPDRFERMLQDLHTFYAKILVSAGIEVSLVTGKWIGALDFKDNRVMFNDNEIFPFSAKLLENPEAENKVIVIQDENAIRWTKKLFKNEYTGNEEKLDIQIEKDRSDGKIPVLIRSVNKMKILDKSMIKIIEVV